jgi:putative ABC transport system permease protein
MFWIIYANVKKRKSRLLMTVGGIAIGVATLFALLALSSGIEGALEREIGGLGAHIILLPEGCPYTQTLALMQGAETVEHVPDSVVPRVRETENVRATVPVLVGKVKANGTLVPIYGTTEDIFEIKSWGETSLSGALVGGKVAADLKLKVGDSLHLDLYEEVEVEVASVLPTTGGRDDTFVFLPLATAQRLLGLQGSLSAVLVQTTNLGRVNQTRTALGKLAEVQAVPPSEIFDALIGLFSSVKQTLILITGIAIVVGVLTTMNTMTMAVYERRRDIGLLRALGATRRNVFTLFVSESLLVSLAGGLAGLAVGYAAAYLLPRTSGFGIDASPHFALAYVGICLVVAAAVGTLSAIYPAMMAARTQPIRTLREL